MARRAKSETVQLKVRMKEPLRALLEKAADERGISMNTEAVDRLQRTFQNQKILQEALDLSFGSEISGMLMVIGDVMRTTAQTIAFTSTGDPSIENWSEEPLIYDAVAKAVATVFEQHNPRGQLLATSDDDAAKQMTADDIARGIAIKRMWALKKKGQTK